MIKNPLFLLMLTFFTVAPLQISALEKEIDLTSKSLEFYELECDIMTTDAVNSSMIACERTIRLIDLRQGNRRLRTLLSNSQGTPIAFSSFRQGDRIFLRGFLQEDGSIHAREIYQLPPRSGVESPPVRKPIADWRWQTVP